MTHRALRRFQTDINRLIDRRSDSATHALFDGLVNEIRQTAYAAGNSRNAIVYVDRAIRAALSLGQGRLVSALILDIKRIAEEAALEGARRAQHTFEHLDGAIPPALTNEVLIQEKARIRARADADDLKTNFGPVLVAALVTVVNASFVKAEQEKLSRDDTLREAVESLRTQKYIVDRAAKWHASHAYNAVQGDIFQAVWPQVPDLMKRWTEHVNDIGNRPLDKRVAPDSLAMHGQLAFPNQTFVMPPDPKVPADLHGMQWSHPPNRPNDRAVVTPWRPLWGVPGWIWRDGRKMRFKVQ